MTTNAQHRKFGEPAAYLCGVYNIVPTPFDESGALDVPSLRRLVDFVIGTGVTGITILGVLGEAGKLSEAERTRTLEVAIETAADRVPVCVGATHAATDRCIAYSREAEAAGAAALLVAPPALARSNEAAVRRHYEAVSAATSLPLVVQDYPPVSGVFMTPAFIGALASDVPACRWLKLEDDPTAPKTSAVLASNPAIGVFGGLGGVFMLEELQRGAIGTMTGFGFPEVLVAVYQRFAAGDVEGAQEVFFRYVPLMRFENQTGINLPLRKHIYQVRGVIASSRARAPHATLDAITLRELDGILTYLGLSTPGPVTIR
jgi:4-hydroxy-tetrahydrodipicolinate synthase